MLNLLYLTPEFVLLQMN